MATDLHSTDPTQPLPGEGVGRYAAFLVAGRRFAVPAADVAEVLRDGRVNKVPRAPESLAGLLNLRGRIVPVIDLERRLGLTTTDAGERDTVTPARPPATVHLVLQATHEWCSLLVDEILDVVEIPIAAFQPVVAQQATDATDATTAVYAGEDGLMYLLDVRQVLRPAPRSRPPSSTTPST
jgi:purine-binding chemotaxis protein CheW